MKKKPIVALIYDFDGTLSPGNMQEFGFIQAVGKTPKEFWTMSDGLAAGQDASNVLSYMKMMFDEARKNGITLRRCSPPRQRTTAHIEECTVTITKAIHGASIRLQRAYLALLLCRLW